MYIYLYRNQVPLTGGQLSVNNDWGRGLRDGQRVSNYAARCVAVFLCSSNCLENQDKLFNSRPTRKSPPRGKWRRVSQLFVGSQFCTIYLNLNCHSNWRATCDHKTGHFTSALLLASRVRGRSSGPSVKKG